MAFSEMWVVRDWRVIGKSFPSPSLWRDGDWTDEVGIRVV